MNTFGRIIYYLIHAPTRSCAPKVMRLHSECLITDIYIGCEPISMQPLLRLIDRLDHDPIYARYPAAEHMADGYQTPHNCLAQTVDDHPTVHLQSAAVLRPVIQAQLHTPAVQTHQ